ncbi:MAG: thioredoxin domain-containing protein [Propionibacteriaceae bacterium]|nr:thioredoxin domain-containing protein [Propionibacteriaceae bacterium]
MANNAGPSRREAMRLKAEAEEARARRNSRVLWISLSAVAVAVVVILALVISQTLGKDTPSADQQMPPNATEQFGIELKTRDVEPAADAPHLVIWEEFRCPACASREADYGPAVKQLVDEGKITAEVRTAHFFDPQDGTDNSERAALAAASADAVGKFREYHTTVFESLLATGTGYTDQQLTVDFPAQAGIEGDDLAKFQELYNGRAFADFVKEAGDEFSRSGISGTPTYMVGENKLEFADEASREILIQPTPEDMLRAITEANS